MQIDPNAIAVVDHPEANRYEARVEGHVAVITYSRQGEVIAFTHTGVPEALEGRGVGQKLARTVLDEARDAGLAVLPFCPFVAAYVRRHREYMDLVPEDFWTGR